MRDSHRAVGVLLGFFAALAVGGQALDVVWESSETLMYTFGWGFTILAPLIVAMNGLQLSILGGIALTLCLGWAWSFRAGRSGRLVAALGVPAMVAAGLLVMSVPVLSALLNLDSTTILPLRIILLVFSGWEPLVMVPAFAAVAALGRDSSEPVDPSSAALWLASGATIGASMLGGAVPLVVGWHGLRQAATGLQPAGETVFLLFVLARLTPSLLGFGAAALALSRGRARSGRSYAAIVLVGVALGNGIAFLVTLSWPSAAASLLALPLAALAFWLSGVELRAESASALAA